MPMAKDVSVIHDPHPCTGPSMVANTMPPTARIVSSPPTGSSLGGWASTELGTTAIAPTSANTASTMLSAKNELQENHSSSSPEATNPSTAPPLAIPIHKPIARGRRSGGKDVVMIDSVVGITIAAPTPISAR